jgi:hypothetical protein
MSYPIQRASIQRKPGWVRTIGDRPQATFTRCVLRNAQRDEAAAASTRSRRLYRVVVVVARGNLHLHLHFAFCILHFAMHRIVFQGDVLENGSGSEHGSKLSN